MNAFHPATVEALHYEIAIHQRFKDAAAAVADMYDTSEQTNRHTAVIADLTELIKLIGQADRDAADDDRIAIELELGVEPDPAPMHCMLHDTPPIPPGGKCLECDPRAALIADARRLFDFLEANPEVPLDYHALGLSVHMNGSDAERIAAVDAAAEVLGTTVDDRFADGGHYTARRRFGQAEYKLVAICSTAMRRHHDVMRLGEAAVAGIEAERAPAEVVVTRVELVSARAMDEDQPAEPARGHGHDVLHACPPIGSGSAPRCGASGPTALFASDVTCQECRSLMKQQARDAGEPGFFGDADEDFEFAPTSAEDYALTTNPPTTEEAP